MAIVSLLLFYFTSSTNLQKLNSLFLQLVSSNPSNSSLFPPSPPPLFHPSLPSRCPPLPLSLSLPRHLLVPLPSLSPSLSTQSRMGITDQIKEVEAEMARTQKNKATEHHLGRLKAKLARLRAELMAPAKSTGKGEGFEVMKSGDARVVMIGFPSVGKSTCLTKLTDAKSESAAYEFTTLTCIPGLLTINDANIQLLDLPGIIEGASRGIGKGKQVVSVARTADVILMVLDAGKHEETKPILEDELYQVGIRLNQRKPNLYFKEKSTGGITINALCPLKNITEKTVLAVLKQYKIHNCELLLKDENTTVEDLIDTILGNTVYIPCIYVYNKVDTITIEEVDEISRMPHSLCVSLVWDLNIDEMLDMIWDYLGLVRVYTKAKGDKPDFTDPIVVRRGASIEAVCHYIHRSLADDAKGALVWGTSAKHTPQRVSMTHTVEDEDVVQIIK
eukprot:TRINITY_DN403_c1_g1_i3.p1 TRINITY_DN403_c1_g1~~TRINITY_DN403_c1_g1_i3.p1  ORF type:complete len:447 (-),score=125.02 TRINITY_DN403_c1_g1_i3:12-1352(-)